MGQSFILYLTSYIHTKKYTKMTDLGVKEFPAFKEAGKKKGIQVWRCENLKPVSIGNPTGTFYTGDSYIVLETIEVGQVANLYFWIGAESSQDEYASIAAFAVNLDNQLGGFPVQYRECQGNESDAFNKLFPMVQYKEGGVASGATHVETNADNNLRLMRIKGRQGKAGVRCTQVPFKWSSITNDDIYIIEIGSDLYRYRAAKSNLYEWAISADLCQTIIQDEQQGNGTLTDLSAKLGEEVVWPQAVLDKLGADVPKEFPAGESDKKVKVSKAALYKVSDDTGKLETTKVYDPADGDRPKFSIMETDDVYILDNGANGTLYVWKGSTSKASERSQGMQNAMQFITDKGYDPRTCSIEVFPQGHESAIFKSFFAGNTAT